LRLGFTLLTGGKGITGTVAALRTLGTVGGPVFGRMSGWGALLGSFSKNIGGVTGLLPALRGGLLTAFLSPGAAVGSLVKGIGGLALRLTGLPAIWG